MMIRKFLAALVLFTMTLHCSSRLGFLNLIYQHRQQISLSLGLISEIPIAVCNSDYDFSHKLEIQSTEEKTSTLPPVLIQAREIILFFDSYRTLAPFKSIVLSDYKFPSYTEHFYPIPLVDIFQPPKI